MAKKIDRVTNCIVISDTHFGDQLSLCPRCWFLYTVRQIQRDVMGLT